MNLNFIKALHLLDAGNFERAKEILREIILKSKNLNQVDYIKANCVLGEIYFQEQLNDEAKQCLSEVVNSEAEDDIVDYEKQVAQDLLNQINEYITNEMKE